MPFGTYSLKIVKAVREKKVDEVCRFLSEHAAKNENAFFHGISPLLIACSEPEGKTIAKFLIEEAKMDVNLVCSRCGLTPLMMACRNGNVEVVKYLLQHPDIDPNKEVNSTHLTAFKIAILMTPLLKTDIELFKALLGHEKTDVNVISTNEESEMCTTLFMSAIGMKRFDIADLIINDKRFKVENVLKLCFSELHDVILADYPNEELRFDHIKKLVAAGADPGLRQDFRKYDHKDNCNAIDLARDYGYTAIADYLETVRLKQSDAKYKELRKNSNLDLGWQENPNRIYDSLDGLVAAVDSMKISVTP